MVGGARSFFHFYKLAPRSILMSEGLRDKATAGLRPPSRLFEPLRSTCPHFERIARFFDHLEPTLCSNTIEIKQNGGFSIEKHVDQMSTFDRVTVYLGRYSLEDLHEFSGAIEAFDNGVYLDVHRSPCHVVFDGVDRAVCDRIRK